MVFQGHDVWLESEGPQRLATVPRHCRGASGGAAASAPFVVETECSRSQLHLSWARNVNAGHLRKGLENDVVEAENSCLIGNEEIVRKGCSGSIHL